MAFLFVSLKMTFNNFLMSVESHFVFRKQSLYKVPRGTKTEIDKKDLSVSFFTAKKCCRSVNCSSILHIL